MKKVICEIFHSTNESAFSLMIEIGRDGEDKPFWKFLSAAPVPFPRFTATEGDWWHTSATSTLRIYSDEAKTLEFSLPDVPDTFYMLTCGPAPAIQGSGVRFPNMMVKYSIRAIGTCKPPRPKTPRRTR